MPLYFFLFLRGERWRFCCRRFWCRRFCCNPLQSGRDAVPLQSAAIRQRRGGVLRLSLCLSL